MKIKIVEPARREFLEAKEYYEIEQSGLGNKFATEIKRAIKRIKGYPDAFPEAIRGVRKCAIHKFPYKILYAIEQKDILILAFAHQHRRSNYWLVGN